MSATDHRATGYGHAKIILLGEHAVVYGHPALAGAIDLGVRLSAAPGRLSLRIPEWELTVDADDDHPVATALRGIADAIAAYSQPRRAVTVDEPPFGDNFLDRLPVTLTGVATVPAGAGLGSSAALMVAITKVLAHASRVVLTAGEVANIANVAEGNFHRRPSGVDVALATQGGLALFEPGKPLVAVAAPPLPIVVGFSAAPRSTATMVAHVEAQTRGSPDDPRLVSLGKAARAGATALAAGDLPALGQLLNHAHGTLAELGVSTPTLDRLVEVARSAGALGAKLTGAGGGGAVIALAPERPDDVLAAWREQGFAGQLVRCGGAL